MLLGRIDEVTVRLFDEADIPKKVEWINNAENNQFLHYDIPICCEKTLAWYYAKDNAKRVDCTIEYGGTPVGLIGLLAIDRVHNKAEFYISMGETEYKKRGIATQASKLILDYAFHTMGLHKVYLNTDADNIAAHRLFEKVGFLREGYFVEDMIHRGRYIDRIRYAIVNRNGETV